MRRARAFSHLIATALFVVLPAASIAAQGAVEAAVQSPPGRAPDVTLQAHAVSARVTPGATAAIFGVVSAPRAYTARVVEHVAMVQDADGDGTVLYEVADLERYNSVWLVVDMRNGGSTIAGPAAVQARRRGLPAAALLRRNQGAAAQVRERHSLASFWFVRPGVGAWRTSVGDGSSEDGDAAADGFATALLSQFTPVGTSPAAPEDFAAGDIVVVLDEFALAASDGRVAP